MATATLYANKEHSIAYTSSGLNVGTSNENHAPIGEGNSLWDWKELIRFPMSEASFNGITQITSAVLKVKTTDETHCTNDASSYVRVRGLNGAFAATGGGSNDSSTSWKENADPVWPVSSMGTTGTLGYRNGNWANLTVYEIDITDYIEKYAPSSILKRDGTPCDDAANYGMVLDCNGVSGKSVEFKSMRGSYTPRIIVTGTVTPTPNAPTTLAPSGTQTSVPTDSDFSWSGDASNDENPLSSWDLQIQDAGTGDSPSYDIGWSTPDATRYDKTWGISGVNVSNPAGLIASLAAAASSPDTGTITLARGNWYAFRVRHENSEDTNGSWSRDQTFYIANLPDAPTWVDPTVAKPYAPISNLDDLNIWTDSGGEAIAELEWTYTHPDLLAMDDFTVNWGGVEYTKTDFGFAADKTWASGETITIPAPAAQARGAANSVNVYITATDTSGNTSSASSTVACVVQWSQAITQENHGSGAGNFEFDHANVTGGSSSQVEFLFRKGDGTPGSWYTDVSEVTPSTHMDILVRLATNDSTNNPQLPDYTLSYLSTGNVNPDLWTGSSCTVVLDNNVRRFGKRSAKVTITSQYAFIQPDYGDTEPAIIVTPGQAYTFSAFMRTVTALSDNLQLRIYDDNYNLIASNDSCAIDTGSEWERHSLTYTVPDGITKVRPVIRSDHASNVGKTYWVDSVQHEEGSITSQWKPGGIGPAVSIDVGGVMVDGEKGGVFRVSAGNADEFSSTATGFEFSGDIDVGGALEAGALDTYGVIIDGGSGVTHPKIDTDSASAQLTLGGTAAYIRPRADMLPYTDLAYDLGRDDYRFSRVYAKERTFTVNGTSWTRPTDPPIGLLIQVLGGGGGGGGVASNSSGQAAAAGGGGGGAYLEAWIEGEDIPASLTISQGDRGAGGSAGNNSGSAGGDSRVYDGSLTIDLQSGGGGGGSGMSNTAGNGSQNGGAGGTIDSSTVPSGSTLLLAIRGGEGSHSRVLGGDVCYAGDGGDSALGQGGMGGMNGAGAYASNHGYGGGGGGASQTGNSTNKAGGYGGYGRVMITEFYS